MKYALTGGMGSGKSLALSYFAGLGFATLNADDIGREVSCVHRAMIDDAVTARWGIEYAPQAVADIIFADPAERDWFTSLVHPLIFDKLQQELEEIDGDVIVEVPLLYEYGWEPHFDKVICVWTPIETARQRVIEARGWSAEETDRRLTAQLDPDEKLRRADYGLINRSTPEALYEQCAALAAEFVR